MGVGEPGQPKFLGVGKKHLDPGLSGSCLDIAASAKAMRWVEGGGLSAEEGTAARVGINQGAFCQPLGPCGKVIRAVVPGQASSDTINPASRKSLFSGHSGVSKELYGQKKRTQLGTRV